MTGRLALFPMILVIGLSVGACDTAEERAEKHYQSALALIAEGDDQRARVELQNVFKLDPLHREARLAIAKLLDNGEDPAAAFRAYLFVAEQYPDDFDAALRLAEIAIEANAWDEAELYGRRAAEIDAEPMRVSVVVAILDYRQAALDGDTVRRGQEAERIAVLLDETPDNVRLRQILVDWEMFQGREREALRQIDLALESEPDNRALNMAKAGILEALGEFPALEEHLKGLVAKFPDQPEMAQQLLRWYMSRGQADAAEAFLRDMLASADGDDRADLQVAIIQFLVATQGNEAALAEIDTLLAETPDHALIRSIRASLWFEGERRDEAIAEMQELVSAGEPSDETRRFKVALARMQRETRNNVGARALVEEVLAEDPSNVEALKVKADILIDADKADDAILLLRQALTEDPEDAAAMTLMARAHERNGNRDLMGESLARAAEVSGNRPAESLRLARFLISRQQYAPAEQALKEALRRNATNLELLSQLGQVYLRMEKLDDARFVEESLRSFEDERATAMADRLQLAALRAQNRNADIVAMVESLARSSGGSSRATIALMRTHLANDDLENAKRVLLEGIEDDPENLQLLFSKGIIASIEGSGDEARAIYRDVLAKEPNASNVWLALARSHQSEGDAASAEAVIDEALEILPSVANVLWAKAGYLERGGDIPGAIDIYEQLYETSSNSVIAANNLASLLSSYSDDPEVVERAYSIARRLRGLPQPAFQDTYGWIAYQRGQLDEALEHLEPAAEGLPENPLVQYHLARTYEALENFAAAAEAYERVLEIVPTVPAGPLADTQDRLSRVVAATESE